MPATQYPIMDGGTPCLLAQQEAGAASWISGLAGSLRPNIIPRFCASPQYLDMQSIVPSSNTLPIDPSFPGFAFEQASFYNYSFDADGNPNEFSHNLIDSVLKRTGGTPILRVGGTSGDFAHYNASQDEIVNRPATEGGPAFGRPWLSVGKSYFKAFENFPGAQFIFMVPLVHRDLENTLEWTRLGLEAIGDRLQALEIGNEPDLYRWFGVKRYVNAFTRFQKALSKEFPDKLDGKIYQGLDTAWGGARKLKVEDAMDAGINNTGQVKQVAYHLYQRGNPPNAGLESLQRRVANHTAIVKVMSAFEPHIAYLRQHAPGTPFLLSENGNSLGFRDENQRNVLATALWNVDYQLHAMAIGVTRVNNQQIVLPGYQMWEPVQSDFTPPLVRANYYSQPLVADFIGPSGATKMLELDVAGDLLAAYAAYDRGRLARLALVNLHLWIPEHGPRPTADLVIAGLPDYVREARVAALTAPTGAYANDTLTYDGLQWTYESRGLEVRVAEGGYRTEVSGGRLRVGVEATSAILVDLTGGWEREM